MYLGIDIGSTYIKAALLDESEVLYEKIETGWNPKSNAKEAVQKLLQKVGKSEDRIRYSVSTGYGRNLFSSDDQVTEITCHALGSAHLFPKIDFIIDVGGQDCKAVKINQDGRVLDFAMNDKCAAGTGKFLQIMAERMKLDMHHFSALANLERPAKISNMCTVFAETEVIGLIAEGESEENIIGGIFLSVARRISSLALKIKGSQGALVGGGSNFSALKVALERELGTNLQTNQYSEFTGAVGAMLLAKKLEEKHGTQSIKTI